MERYETLPTQGHPQNTGIFGEVQTDSTILAQIAAARSGTSFAEMRRDYALAAAGTVGAAEGLPVNAFGADPARQAPQA